METVTFGNGCFWCTEAIFQNLKGVERVESGYSGGHVEKPSYEDVCAGITGHAEVIQLEYDEKIITFEEILEVFFATHDPTTLNRQGNDVGTQYRSVIFYHNETQKELAEQVIKIGNESGAWDKKIVTKVTPFKGFYSSGSYHDNFFNRVGSKNSYCNFVVIPKIDKFKKEFKKKLKQNG